MSKRWAFESWGSASDPIHKSDLTTVTGKFGCLQQFFRKKSEFAAEGERQYAECNGKLAAGTAVHEVLHRLCKSPTAVAVMLHETESISHHSLTAAYDDEFEKERNGRPVAWFKTKADKHRNDCLEMLFGIVREFRNHVARVELAEAGFVYPIAGVWLTGSIDLIFEPRAHRRTLANLDWKTGVQKPHQIDLDHGWEGAIYANALKSGIVVPYDSVEPRENESHRIAMERVCIEIAQAWERVDYFSDEATNARKSNHSMDAIQLAESHAAKASRQLEDLTTVYDARSYGEFPSAIRHVHLRDFVPYLRKSKPMMSRPEEMEWAGIAEPAKVEKLAGESRGPGFYRVGFTEAMRPRLEHLLRAVVAWVRLGMFPAAPGEMCSRCRFREPCLLDGYQPTGEERRQLEQVVEDLGGFDGNIEL